jgi:hypothetical protein
MKKRRDRLDFPTGTTLESLRCSDSRSRHHSRSSVLNKIKFINPYFIKCILIDFLNNVNCNCHVQIRTHQGLVLGQLGDRLPDSGQLLRLRGGRDINAGYVQISTGGSWHNLCDPTGSSWGLQEATVACRQLGYDHGVLHTTHGNSTIGDLSKGNQRCG